jgi:hypothetical protein
MRGTNPAFRILKEFIVKKLLFLFFLVSVFYFPTTADANLISVDPIIRQVGGEKGIQFHWEYPSALPVGGEILLGDEQDSLSAAPAPEPATLLLLGAGLIALAACSRRKFKNH